MKILNKELWMFEMKILNVCVYVCMHVKYGMQKYSRERDIWEGMRCERGERENRMGV